MSQKNKKILVVSQYFWPEDFRVNELVLGLQADGHIVEVLTSTPNYPSGHTFPEFQKNASEFSSYNGINIHRVKQIPRGKNKLTLALNYISFVISSCLYCIFSLRKNKYDVIFAIQLSPIFSVIPAILCKFLFRIPLHIWVLDIWPDSLFSSKNYNTYLYKFFNKICCHIYSSADTLLLTSKGFKKRLIAMEVKKPKLLYLPQWVEQAYKNNNEYGSPEDKQIKSLLSKWSDKKVFLFAGNIGEAQDFDNVLLSFKKSSQLDDLVFLIVGDGRYKTKLTQLINEYNLENNVFLLGRYPSKFMPYFYHYSDVLVFSLLDTPIFALTLPGKVQSYMSSGTMIIGMVNGESSAVINEANCGFTCNSGDVNGFSILIDQCLTYSNENLRSIGKNGKEYALRNFDFNSTIKKLSQSL